MESRSNGKGKRGRNSEDLEGKRGRFSGLWRVGVMERVRELGRMLGDRQFKHIHYYVYIYEL